MKQIISTVAILLTLFSNGISQDIHFAQFNMTPLIINPALTGVFFGDHRASLNYRDQWTGFGNGYRTYSFSFDASVLKKNSIMAF